MEAGDLIIDGGNEWYLNTLRRGEALAAKGLSFMGMGVSGGEEGARNGPAIMPGGTREAYEQVRPILEVRVVCVLRVGGGLASWSALHAPSAAQCNTGKRSRACKGCAFMSLTLAQRCSFACALREQQQQPTVVVAVATCCSDHSFYFLPRCVC